MTQAGGGVSRLKRVAVVGRDGRGHALVWALSQSPRISQVVAMPGSSGTKLERNTLTMAVDIRDPRAVVRMCREQGIDLVIPSGEAFLVGGIADAAERSGITVFGPSKRAARLTEGSKCDAKEFMARHGIPTAPFGCFKRSDAAEAVRYIDRSRSFPGKIVIKPDGLTGGKGVVIAQSRTEAVAAVKRGLEKGRVVIEEFLDGRELSYFTAVAGDWFMPLPPARDYKLLGEKMTGGMASYSPVPYLTPALEWRVTEKIIKPTIYGLIKEGAAYRGFLYFGLMVVGGEPYVLEYNCRLGDPEAQAILPRMKTDLMEIIGIGLDPACRRGFVPSWDERASFALVLASEGYPGHVRVGDRIEGLADAERMPGIKVFHSGTTLNGGGHLVTDGGRVLTVTAMAETPASARTRAYAAANRIKWSGMQFLEESGAD